VCHVWKLSNGKATSFQQYVDTAQMQEAMGTRDAESMAEMSPA
jgi:ketosteroid isomerase-like protein